MTTPVLGALFDPRNNSIGAMRFICASLVIVGHSVPFGGYGIDPLLQLTNNQTAIGRWPVDMFFVLSGFLLVMSLERSTLASYARNRFLRIYPAYWVCLIVCGIAVPLSFGAAADWDFIARGLPLILYVRQEIPGVFEANPITSINGPLWTLPIELACYISLPIAAALGFLTRRGVLVAVGLAAAAFWAQIWFSAELIAIHPVLNPVTSPLRLATFFYAGCAMWVWRDAIPITGRHMLAAAAILVASTCLGTWIDDRPMGLFYLAAPFCLTYLTVAAAVLLGWTRFNARTDLSYGIYIYGTLILQILTATGLAVGALPWAVYLAFAFALTLAAAAASWFAIEKPSLDLKRRSWTLWPRRA